MSTFFQSRLTPTTTESIQGESGQAWSEGSRDITSTKGTVLKSTPILNVYWYFASERQSMFMKRISGADPPWTSDQILAKYRFTNPYRVSDRVTQFLIRYVLYQGSQSSEEIFFRTFLFRMFNKIETWNLLASSIGEIRWSDFDISAYKEVFDNALRAGNRLYSSAYILPSPPFGSPRKHVNQLMLLNEMMKANLPCLIHQAKSLREVFELIKSFPSMGDFLSYQMAIDLNYSNMIDFSEGEFVVPGPGARNGICKCFSDFRGADFQEVINTISEIAEEEFDRLDLTFETLWGRRLQLIDYQNLFCEVDKYTRMSHPLINGDSSRHRMKRKYEPNRTPIRQWYPPKWGLVVPSEYSAFM